MNWSALNKFVEQGILEQIDLFFAARLLAHANSSSEEAASFLSLLFASFRKGQICFKLQASDDLQQAALYQLADAGLQQLPDQLIEKVDGCERMPSKPICQYKDLFYFQKNWVLETQFLHHYLRLCNDKPRTEIDEGPLSDELNSEQAQAIKMALQHSISLLIGGPGTGKTFTAKHLVKHCLNSLSEEKRKKFHIIITAPTGKAVNHLKKQIADVLRPEEQKQLVSGTLHALLCLREDGSQKKEAVLLADLIIVDESSMIDAKIGAMLLASIASGAKVLFIGDQDQLPAIDAGSFFADLIAGGAPATILKQSQRIQNPQLDLLKNAIASANYEEVRSACHPFMQEYKTSALAELAVLFESFFPSFFTDLPSSDDVLPLLKSFKILSTLRQGVLGVNAINGFLLHFFESKLADKGWWAIPIMISKNDYSAELYNGDTGILFKKIGPFGYLSKYGKDDFALFPDREKIPAVCLPAYEYGYCLSVHKSQGSEYDSVALLVPEGSERFGKEILYTAVTRAKKNLKLYAHWDSVEKMLKTTCRKESGLSRRLREHLKVERNAPKAAT